MDLTGRKLAHYEALEPLGAGAMGTVYRARDAKLDRPVALKILPAATSSDSAARFEREARAISALNHPNIATIHAFEHDQGLRFLVLEYVSGGTLRQRIESVKTAGEPFSPELVVEQCLQIARGLAHAHRRGVVHRDIKADNVLVTEDGALKVADFGLARLELDSALTEEGSLLGSMAYIAPEHLLGERADFRADIFSFGVLAYEIAAADPPFRSPHPSALQYEILNAEPPSLREIRPDLPPAFEAIVFRCLEKRPQQRPASMDEVVDALEEIRRQLVSGTSDSGGASASARRAIEVGLTIGRYRLLSKIGEGGMGTVYRALDLSLDRPVALKTLHPGALADPERRKRFVQEARAASALNHPNIVTIHEIDERDGVCFIAMEFLAGETLDRRLARGPLPLAEALRDGAVIADALAAAHSKGIVHRDLKPANVMLTDDGRVKLLDFGLAKFADGGPLGAPGVAPRTEEGAILGTVAYMSPEQAEGKPVDSRSDVFSFGSMFYEMVCGRRAFEGESKVSVLAAILQRPPEPLRRYFPGAPIDLEKVILRCLDKLPERRYQHVGDLRIALEDLLEDFRAGRLTAAPPAPPAPLAAPPAAGRFWKGLAAGAVLGALLALAFLYFTRPGRGMRRGGLRDVALIQVTGSEGLALEPAWSPDGEWIAYASDQGGTMDLWKRPVEGGEPVQLTTGPEREGDPAWSPDGRSLAFSIRGDEGGVFLIPSSGGQSVRVTEFGARPVWSPDGRRLAFDSNGAIYLVNYAGGEPELVVAGLSGTPWAEWAPGGDRLYYWDRTRRDLFVVDLETRRTEALGLIPTGEEAAGLACSPKGDLLVVSKGAFGGEKDLWRVALDPATGRPAEELRRLTVSATDDIQPRFSPDGKRLAFAVRDLTRQMWAFALDPKSGASSGDARLLTHHGKLNYYPAAGRDGFPLAWTSQNAGQGAVFYMAGPGDPERKLTREWNRAIRETGAAVSPDGAQIAFSSTSGGAYRIWRLPALDSVALQATEGPKGTSDVHPAWSADGRSILFNTNRAGNWDLWAVDAAGGAEARPLLDWPSNELYPAASPDGRWIAFSSDKSGDPDIYALDKSNGETRLLAGGPSAEASSAWSPDGRWFYFASDRGGAYAVWVMPAEGGEPRRVTPASFEMPQSPFLARFAVTSRELIAPVETRRGDIYILDNFE